METLFWETHNNALFNVFMRDLTGNQSINLKHMILDDDNGFLYIADTGNQRILKFNVNSGNYSYDLNPYGESLEEYHMMENAEWEILIAENLQKPSGIDLYENRLLVSDFETGQIIIYDISNNVPLELGRIDTGYQNSIMGIKIDSHQKIWYVNYQENTVSFIENIVISGDLNNDTFVNVTDIVLLVDYIINNQNNLLNEYDINSDGIINIVDVVQLVNLILDNSSS